MHRPTHPPHGETPTLPDSTDGADSQGEDNSVPVYRSPPVYIQDSSCFSRPPNTGSGENPPSTTKSNTSPCTCGGCLTNTSCAHTHTWDGDLVVGAYAVPPVHDRDGTAVPYEVITAPHTEPVDLSPEVCRETLHDAMLKDLLERVRRLEKDLAELRQNRDAQ